jgi:hypothetical protein
MRAAGGVFFSSAAGMLCLSAIAIALSPHQESQSNTRPGPSTVGFHYHPDFSDLIVTFSANPSVSSLVVDGLKGDKLEGTRAEVVTDDVFQRAEFVAHSRPVPSEQELIEALRLYARYNGIVAAEYQWLASDGFVKAQLRGTKILDSSGVSTPCTHEAIMAYSSTTYATLLTGGLATGYPTSSNTSFLDSLRHR